MISQFEALTFATTQLLTQSLITRNKVLSENWDAEAFMHAALDLAKVSHIGTNVCNIGRLLSEAGVEGGVPPTTAHNSLRKLVVTALSANVRDLMQMGMIEESMRLANFLQNFIGDLPITDTIAYVEECDLYTADAVDTALGESV